MGSKSKKKIKRRIPVPQKPPKVEKDKKSYDRKSEKRKARKRIDEETSKKNSNHK